MIGLSINAEPILGKKEAAEFDKQNQEKVIAEVEDLIIQGKLSKEQIVKWRKEHPELKKSTASTENK